LSRLGTRQRLLRGIGDQFPPLSPPLPKILDKLQIFSKGLNNKILGRASEKGFARFSEENGSRALSRG
jgi:hypothetical protein